MCSVALQSRSYFDGPACYMEPNGTTDQPQMTLLEPFLLM